MYRNISGKIKTLAAIICLIGIGASIALSIYLFMSSVDVPDELTGQYILFGLLVILVGPPFFWALTFVLYGFGEIIDLLTDLKNKPEASLPSMADWTQEEANAEKAKQIESLRKMRDHGLITDKEFVETLKTIA